MPASTVSDPLSTMFFKPISIFVISTINGKTGKHCHHDSYDTWSVSFTAFFEIHRQYISSLSEGGGRHFPILHWAWPIVQWQTSLLLRLLTLKYCVEIDFCAIVISVSVFYAEQCLIHTITDAIMALTVPLLIWDYALICDTDNAHVDTFWKSYISFNVILRGHFLTMEDKVIFVWKINMIFKMCQHVRYQCPK